MPKVKKVFIINGNSDYFDLFLDKGWEITSSLENADLVVFTGGADVSPSLYGEECHPKAYNDSHRDNVEGNLYDLCIKKSIPMVGICRGGQFLNCKNGGRMYQHVTNHTGNHKMFDILSQQSIEVSSTHHQMMIPNKDGTVIAFANQGGVRERMIGKSISSAVANKDDKDTEVVYYSKTKSLCFQPHPEFKYSVYDGLKDYFFSVIERQFQ